MVVPEEFDPEHGIPKACPVCGHFLGFGTDRVCPTHKQAASLAEMNADLRAIAGRSLLEQIFKVLGKSERKLARALKGRTDIINLLGTINKQDAEQMLAQIASMKKQAKSLRRQLRSRLRETSTDGD